MPLRRLPITIAAGIADDDDAPGSGRAGKANDAAQRPPGIPKAGASGRHRRHWFRWHFGRLAPRLGRYAGSLLHLNRLSRFKSGRGHHFSYREIGSGSGLTRRQAALKGGLLRLFQSTYTP
jgi:hypothetical protein